MTEFATFVLSTRLRIYMYNFHFNCHVRHLDNSRKLEYFTCFVVYWFVQYINATKFCMPTQKSQFSKQALRVQKCINHFAHKLTSNGFVKSPL